jgi:hypothetical protein
MAKQTFTTGQVLTAAQMTSLQQTAMLGGAASAKTASYTLVAADAGTAISMSNAGATTITVNTGLFAAGDTVHITNLGAGVSTITAGTATVNSSASLALAQYESGFLNFTSTSAAIFVKGAGAAAASGGMTLITTTTFDNTAATYTYSSLGSYKHLMIVIDNMTRNNASSVDNLVMQFNNVTTGAPYDSIAFGTTNETFAAVSGFNASNYLLLGWRSVANTSVGTGSRGQVAAWIYDYAGSTKKTYTSIGREQDSGGNRAATNIGQWDSTSAITSITIFTESTNNFNTGTLKLYGVS